MLTDTHTHLDAVEFDQDRDACIQRALECGVTRIITIGAGRAMDSARNAIALADRHSFIWATAGVHPHDASLDFDEAALLELASHPKVVAVGETGLDFFKEWSPRERQYAAFETQIRIAKQVRKPLVIHSRNAGKECLEVLQRLDASSVGGVFHCFAEDDRFAARLRELGFLVSFPGLLTFKNNESTRAICARIPLDQIMAETDAPYMAPVPHRGKRCEVSFVVETARCLATLKGISLEEAAEATTANALRLFSGMR